MRLRSASACLCVLLGIVPLASAQAPGRVEGRVTDPADLTVANVRITATGPAGSFSSVSDNSGRFRFELPPGEYRLTFELEGFQVQTQPVVVAPGQDVNRSVRLQLAAIPQSVVVTTDPGAGESSREPDVGEFVIRAEEADAQPGPRSPGHAALMTPSVAASGPNNALVMAGAFSYGNLFLVDALVATENTRGQSRPFFIQDAVQETRIAAAAVPVEYGRFQGGVVQTITRSGGNAVSGSVRVGITNDQWRALTPYRGDATLNRRVPTWELTIGGPIVKRRLFYFAAALGAGNEQQRTLSFTRVNYPYRDDERRLQAKVSWMPAKSQTVSASYFRVDSSRSGASAGTVMDLASLYDYEAPEWLAGVQYGGVLGGRAVLEARYSVRQLALSGSGASDTSLTAGTPVWDRSRSDARFNSPTGCAVCPGSGDDRNNQDLSAKLTVPVSVPGFGRHEFSVGFDLFQDTRRTTAYQSGSGYRVRATRSVIAGDRIYPVFLPDRTTWIYWQPVLTQSDGNDLRTYSAYAADTWRPSRRLTVKAGLRFDLNDDRDSVGARAVLDAAWSPRATVSWDPTGSGQWLVNAAGSRYVTSINSSVADAASPGGRTATYVFDYLGPAVNGSATAPLVGTEDALESLFAWFLAPPGLGRPTRSAPLVPGVNVRMDPDLGPLDAWEALLGVARQFGKAGSVRVDGIYRRYLDFYANRRDLTTGKVAGAAGTVLDVVEVTNAGDDDTQRRYAALQVMAALRPARALQVSAAYTLSSTRGNVDGEDAAVGPSMVTTMDYPEYRELEWSAPAGPLAVDQRHRLRVWAVWNVGLPPRYGSASLSVVQRVESGRASSAVGSVNPRAYVANPGYAAPPTAVSYYFSPRGAFRTDTLASTDLSAYWSRRLPGVKKGQMFVRAMLTNALNRAAVIRMNRTVLTRNDSTAYLAFNPFADSPVKGVHYDYGTDFGKPVGPFDYQAPREFSISLGLRY